MYYSERINQNFSIFFPDISLRSFCLEFIHFDRSLSGFPRVALEFFKWAPQMSGKCPGCLAVRRFDEHGSVCTFDAKIHD